MLHFNPLPPNSLLFAGKRTPLPPAEREKLDAFERGLNALKKADQKRPHPVIRKMRVNRLVRSVRRFLRQNRKTTRPFVIGISGGSGSGKSTLVSNWQQQDLPVEVIAQDHYYRDMSALRERYRREAESTGTDRFRTAVDLNSPQAVSLDKAARDLKKLRQARPVRVPAYDFVTCTRHNKATPVQPAEVIITEGVFGFVRKPLRQLMDLRIFMRISPQTQAERFWKRAPERGIENDETGRAFLRDVQAKHARHIEPYADKAHIVLDGEAAPADLQATVEALTRLVTALIKKPDR